MFFEHTHKYLCSSAFRLTYTQITISHKAKFCKVRAEKSHGYYLKYGIQTKNGTKTVSATINLIRYHPDPGTYPEGIIFRRQISCLRGNFSYNIPPLSLRTKIF